MVSVCWSKLSRFWVGAWSVNRSSKDGCSRSRPFKPDMGYSGPASTGVIVSFIITVTPFMGFPMLVKALAIVILGGLGSIGGMAIGAFMLAAVETGFAYYIPEGAGWSEGVAFLLIITLLILRPGGLMGQAEH